MFDWRSFDLWLKLQPKPKQEEMKNQIEQGGKPVYRSDTDDYIVVFAPEDDQGQHVW